MTLTKCRITLRTALGTFLLTWTGIKAFGEFLVTFVNAILVGQLRVRQLFSFLSKLNNYINVFKGCRLKFVEVFLISSFFFNDKTIVLSKIKLWSFSWKFWKKRDTKLAKPSSSMFECIVLVFQGNIPCTLSIGLYH